MTTLQLVNAHVHTVLEDHAIICRTRADEDIVIHRPNTTIDVHLYSREGPLVTSNHVIPPGKMIINLYGPSPARDYQSYDHRLMFGSEVISPCEMTYDDVVNALKRMHGRPLRDWSDYQIVVERGAELLGLEDIPDHSVLLAGSLREFWAHAFGIPQDVIDFLADASVDIWPCRLPPGCYFDELCMFLHKYPTVRPHGSVEDFSMYWKSLRGMCYTTIDITNIQLGTKHPAMQLSADDRQLVCGTLAKFGAVVDDSFDAVLDVCWTWDGDDWRNPDECYMALKMALRLFDARRPQQPSEKSPDYI